MASAQTKPKGGAKARNDDRPNHKAFKKGKGRGSRPGPSLSPVQKVLMDGGMLVHATRANREAA